MNKIEPSTIHQQYLQHQHFQHNQYVKNAFQYYPLNKQEQPCPNLININDFPSNILNLNQRKRKNSDLEFTNSMNSGFSTENENAPQSFFTKKCKNTTNYHTSSLNKNLNVKGYLNININKQNISPLSTSISSSQSSSFSLSQNSSSSFISSLNITSNQFLEGVNSSNSLYQEKNNNHLFPKKNRNTIIDNHNFKMQQLQTQNQSQIQLQTSQSSPTSLLNPSENKFKTEMCKNWMEYGKCNYSKKCQFAHGKNELVDKSVVNKKQYKSKLCNSFHTQKYCPYGTRCMFIHEERSVSEIKSSFHYQKILCENIEENINAFPKMSLENKSSHSSFTSSEQNFQTPQPLPIQKQHRLSIFCQITSSDNQQMNSTSSSFTTTITNEQLSAHFNNNNCNQQLNNDQN